MKPVQLSIVIKIHFIDAFAFVCVCFVCMSELVKKHFVDAVGPLCVCVLCVCLNW